MKRTLFLAAILLPLLLLFSSSNNPVANGKIAGDCCQTFRLTDGGGSPVVGCEIIVKDPRGNEVGRCTTNVDGECKVCGLDNTTLYHLEFATNCCIMTGAVPTFYCGQHDVVEIICDANRK